MIALGDQVAAILKDLPTSGLLFPALARIHHNHRAKMFIKRLKTVGISGISLHSYRYASAGAQKRLATRAEPCKRWGIPARPSTGRMRARRR